MERSQNLGNGFYAEAYYKNGEIVIVYRGTDMDKGLTEAKKDIYNNSMLICKTAPNQVYNARKFYDTVAKKHKGSKIYITGHSLGGSLAQIVGSAYKGLETFTFNAYGTAKIEGFHPKYPQNITNYGHSNDTVFIHHMNEHVGKVMLTGDNTPSKLYKTNFDHHSIETMGDISKAVEYKPLSGKPVQPNSFATIKEKYETLRPAKRLEERLQREWSQSAEKLKKHTNPLSLSNFTNRFLPSEKNRIFTKEEVERMNYQTRQRYRHAISEQKEKVGLPTREEASRIAKSGGLVHVKAYVRGDGVHVHEYYRSRPNG